MATSVAPRQPAANSSYMEQEIAMRAHQIMTRSVITIAPDATILKAAKTML